MAHDSVSVEPVDATEQEVVRVDEVVTDGGKVSFHLYEHRPAETEHVRRGARQPPANDQSPVQPSADFTFNLSTQTQIQRSK